MINDILEIVHYGTILVFGVYLSAAFLGVMMNRRNIMILLGFSALCGTINAVFFVFADVGFTEKIYPLIVHLPLIFFLVFFYRYRIVSAVTAVFTVYLCCQLSNWLGLFFLGVTKLIWVYYVVRIIANVAGAALLMCYVAPAMAELLRKSAKDVMILGMMPCIYYIYDYSVTVYTMVLYAGIEVVTEFLGFMLCIFYIFFLLIYFKQYEEKLEAEQRNHMMELQRIQAEKEIEMLNRSERAIAIIRHDMRHYLNDISGFVGNEEYERA